MESNFLVRSGSKKAQNHLTQTSMHTCFGVESTIPIVQTESIHRFLLYCQMRMQWYRLLQSVAKAKN